MLCLCWGGEWREGNHSMKYNVDTFFPSMNALPRFLCMRINHDTVTP
jgi:hypothetical protein